MPMDINIIFLGIGNIDPLKIHFFATWYFIHNITLQSSDEEVKKTKTNLVHTVAS